MRILKRINWRQILVHLVAMWLITCGATFLAFLTDIELNQSHWPGNEASAIPADFNQERVTYLTRFGLIIGVSKILGLVLALVVSIFRKWLWLNAFIAFVLSLLSSNWYTITSQSFLTLLIQSIGPNDFLYFLIVGLLTSGFGILLFFLKPVTDFINVFFSSPKSESDNEL